jgi:2-polyprenyl-3-methyl-5-hydroxy-6-metoxy-1,4-benzoquinol methylase
MDIEILSKEIAEFLNIDPAESKKRLAKGFHENHKLVAEDFVKNKVDVNNPSSLLNWYKNTEAYIWELSSYHLEPMFNYSGMCAGIAQGLKSTGRSSVLCMGDGIGTLSLECYRNNLHVTYHDLKDSKTCNFALSRFDKAGAEVGTLFTDNWNPVLGKDSFDAVVALDFFEHLVNVEEWVEAVYKCLKKDGAFIAQNAFAIGDAENGNSIPMHLSINNKYAEEWGNVLLKTGFKLHSNNSWWIKS